jgi:cysteine desulfuration protein SufE
MALPPKLTKAVERFRRAPDELRVQALLQYAKKVPPLPDELLADRGALEKVHECQTPFFLATTVDEEGAVHVFFDAPPESPTVRGFAGILYEGLEGEPWGDVLSVPPDFYGGMGLEGVVSPLRLRGMGAILARLQRQVREAVGEAGRTAGEGGGDGERGGSGGSEGDGEAGGGRTHPA